MTEQRACAVVGSPITHSRSPQLHLAAYADLGLDWVYVRREVTEGALSAFCAQVAEHGLEGLPCGGLSVTMPGKQEALALASRPAEHAQVLQAANTLVPIYDAHHITGWAAYNTDVHGVIGALRESGVALLTDQHVVIIGAGGTAAAAAAALGQLGAGSIDVISRSPERTRPLIEIGEQLEVTITQVPWEAGSDTLSAADVIVSTVPPGVADALTGARFHDGQTVLDAAYAGGQSLLLRTAEAAGARCVSGELMLLHQAVEQVRLMTGRSPDVGVMRAALTAER